MLQAIADAEIFNVEKMKEDPVTNEITPAITEVKVVVENGTVTILNAALAYLYHFATTQIGRASCRERV